jgi:hypothetical protein
VISIFTAKPAQERKGEKVLHEELKGVKFLSFNCLFQYVHALDILLNSLQTREQVLKAFSIDTLENFKPIVDILASLQQWDHRYADIPLLSCSIDRVKTFFETLRRKTYLSSSSSGISISREHNFADQVALFLEEVLKNSDTELNRFAAKNDSQLLVNCYSVD